jgi:hypothetical protein
MARGAEEGALDVLLARKRGVREEIVGWWRSVPFNGGGGGVWGRRHTTGLGEGTRCSMAVAAGPLEPDRGGNGQAAHARVAGTKTGEVGLPSGAPLQSRAARSNGLNHFQIQTFKMFKFFQTLTDQKIISLNYKNWK